MPTISLQTKQLETEECSHETTARRIKLRNFPLGFLAGAWNQTTILVSFDVKRSQISHSHKANMGMGESWASVDIPSPVPCCKKKYTFSRTAYNPYTVSLSFFVFRHADIQLVLYRPILTQQPHVVKSESLILVDEEGRTSNFLFIK